MPKAAPAKSVAKSASKSSKGFQKEDKPKEKRAPSAWNVYYTEHLPAWKANPANADKKIHAAMAEIAGLWRNDPANPKRGQAPRKRAKKSADGPPVDASSSAPSSSQSIADSDD
ncbi:hypothetical protein CYLTODRAFT_443262 [Cylindrobasidium torrendii FP15055 ss-10]|uniref:HMG box domain-containing protein n=1 Tax=Cylindrobasidium torrendii FP15055 ss-10 TaxID=1314674 RepID=A0A0D7BEH0_9AGAR|nr:hypothetical protein CYLTODRAFT_443262 [Cylindrobasidium torrendii FP15055 ss-10]